jgi:Mn2+/Fe2+ NRAMP family transporter
LKVHLKIHRLIAAGNASPTSRPQTRHQAERTGDRGRSRWHGALFYLSFGAVVAVAAAIVPIPGAPLIEILFLTQALNAVVLLALLPFMRSLGRDEEPMGEHALGRTGRATTGIALAVIAVAVLALGVLALG